MKKTIILLAVLSAGLAACLTEPVMLPTIHIEPPSPSAAASLTLDDRIAVGDAWAYLRQGRTEKAMTIFVRLGPRNAFAVAGQAYIALMRNDLAGAEELFDRALEIQSDLTSAYLGLGQLYQKSGQDVQAYRTFLEALKRDPDNEFARRESEAIAEGKTAEAMAEARAAESAGQTEKGKEAYLRALEYSPKLLDAHRALARISIKQKDFPSALFHLQTAAANGPEDTGLWREYADALFEAGQWSRSLDAYQQIVALDPQNKSVKDRVDQIKNRLGVADLPDQFGSIADAENVTKEDVAALIGVRFREALADVNPKPPIIVDITTSWAQRYIHKVAALGILEVFSNHTFQPKKTMNRGELAEAIVRLIEVLKKNGFPLVPQIPIERVRISDVPEEHFYFVSIAQAVAYRVMDLAPDRTFKPDLPVSGREAVKIFDFLAGLIK